MKLIDQLQDQHGHWTVLRQHPPTRNPNTGQLWITCQCTCGTTKQVRLDKLIYGHIKGRGSQSCGCQRGAHQRGTKWPTKPQRNDPAVQPGSQHGWLTALTHPRRGPNPKNRNPIADFQCKCGTTITRQTNGVLSGDSTSCGCYRRTQAHKRT